MKVKNKEFKEKQIGKDYRSVFLRSVKNASVEGMTVGQMKDLRSLIDKLEIEGTEIDLTKKEIETIKEKTRAIKWLVFNKELIEMDEYLESLA